MGNDNWQSLWSTTCHQLWYWRNQQNYTPDYVAPYNLVENIKEAVRYYNHIMFMQKKVVNRGTNIIVKDSHKPDQDWICINTNGAVAKNNEAGCGGLAKNIEGIWLGGFSKRVGKCVVLPAELWGCVRRFKASSLQRF